MSGEFESWPIAANASLRFHENQLSTEAAKPRASKGVSPTALCCILCCISL